MLRKAALRQLIHRPMTTLLMILIMGLSLGISLFLSALHEGIMKDSQRRRNRLACL